MKLEKYTDEDLINKVKTKNCEDSLGELINRHSNLCYKIFYKYSFHFPRFKINIDDFYSEKDLVIYNAAKSYNSEKKAKFVTWVGRSAVYYCLNALKKNEDYTKEQEFPENFEIPVDNFLKNEDSNYVLEILKSLADERILKVFELRYFDGKKLKPWKQIGEKIGLSHTTVQNLHDKGLKLLRAKMKNKDIIDRT